MYQKSVWKGMVWDRAWSLENMAWRIEYRLQQSLDLVSAINPNPNYLTWWALSDKYPERISMCETMTRLVCHASLLLIDDIRLKKQTILSRCCPLCDSSVPDDVKHLVLQCPSTEQRRIDMYAELRQCTVNLEARLNEIPEEILPILLGKCLTGYTTDQMEDIWIVAGSHIDRMYRENLITKSGIG